MMTYGFYAYPDYDYPPACILLWGFNPETTHPSVYQKIRHAVENGSKIIVIDPAKNRLTEKAEVWLRPKPGTDLALALGMLKVILDEELLDRRFVQNWTIGLDKLKRQLDGLSLERIEEITWIDQKYIQKAARVYSTVKPGCISWGNAVETDHRSFQTCRAICLLRAVTGNLCMPGSDIKYSELGELSRRSPLFLQSQNIPDRLRAERLSAAEGLLPQFQHAPHQLLLKSILDEKPYPIRAAYLQGANLLLSAPDAGKTMEALKKLEFTAAVDFFMTPTTHMADIILPAATYLEYDSVEQPWHFCTAAVQRKVVQVGEARSNGQILNDLARKLGFEERVWDDMEMALDEFLKPAGMTFKEFNNIGRLFGEKQYRHYESGGFDTPSGKVELYSPRMEEWGFDAMPEYIELTGVSGQEPVDTQKFPLILTSRKMKTFYHSCGRQIRSLRQVRPHPHVYIHRETAGKLGIAEGDWVSISTQRGTIYQKACPVDWLDPRVVMAEHGWWYPEKGPEACFGWDESNVNVLTDSGKPWNPEVGSACLRGICCRVAKADEHQ
jgi:anaerobic selenocysteine-containing dehydrogenase